ncbi:hypothetical protein [Gemella cuniculi]|uniref:hypothetical protein n=1 Tax=Gemella cuniculi TaxID=150240 RepID=UPI00041EC338|nr:hypothetical protein [Gemella cuniculi]
MSLFLCLTVALYFTTYHIQKINSDLDFSTDWRKDLSKIAGKSRLTLKDAYIVRSKLRFVKHEGNLKPDTFKDITNKMIDYIEGIKAEAMLSDNQANMIRLFCRYLLKIHWENRNIMAPRTIFSKIRLLCMKDKKYGREFNKEYDRLMKNKNKENDEIKNENIEEQVEKLKTDVVTLKEKSKKVREWNPLAVLLVFLAVLVAFLKVIKYFNLVQDWKDVVVLILVSVFSLLIYINRD